ncbi:MAG: hypothetical protein AAGM22_20920 [Acidobacteriota bacterium]
MLRTCLLIASLAAATAATPPAVGAQTLASGLFDLPNSTGPGDPGFNSALTANRTLPADLPPTAGAEIHVRLRDVSRPDMVCDLDDTFGDLFSGCAAVDWPFPGRRGINLVEVETDQGLVTLHLRMNDTLSLDPEPDGP